VNIDFLSAEELAQGFADSTISPVEATETALRLIETHDATLNAFRLVDSESARKSACASEQRWQAGEPLSPIDGVPTSIKDLLLVKGWPTLRGSRLINPDQRWDEDAPGVARLREAGVVLLGKTNTAEFGWKGTTDSPLAGVTRNPWNPELTPGGSSGGAAAALASGMGTLALCTDGGGSIRNPASFTNLCGLKPTFGRVPAYPPNPIGTLATTGPLARRVGDLALMMTVITKPDPRDWLSLPANDFDYRAAIDQPIETLQIAYCPDLGFAKLDPEVASAVDVAAKTFETLGAHVELADPGIGDTTAIFNTHWLVGVANALGGLPEDKLKLLDTGLADFVLKGRSVPLIDYLTAQNERVALGQRMRLFHEEWDLLLLPTTAVPAFPANRRAPPEVDEDDFAAWTPFSYPFNLTLQPAVSVPCGFTANGRPIGLQIVGGMYRDDLVLRAARAYEEANPLYDRHPVARA
jgi:aspartyl-tRNA(Asn)/glutamyl-tRNA(Gln) amidotransferase subunit A